MSACVCMCGMQVVLVVGVDTNSQVDEAVKLLRRQAAYMVRVGVGVEGISGRGG